MIIKKNDKELGDIKLNSIPAIGSKIEYKGKKYQVQSFLIENETNKSIIEVI